MGMKPGLTNTISTNDIPCPCTPLTLPHPLTYLMQAHQKGKFTIMYRQAHYESQTLVLFFHSPIL